MAAYLPNTLMILAGIALFLALAALWRSFQALFGRREASTNGLTANRASLLEEKHALLISLKDLVFEKELGKLSEQDFLVLERRYRQQAYEVLQALDEDLGPFINQAEQLIAVRINAGAER